MVANNKISQKEKEILGFFISIWSDQKDLIESQINQAEMVCDSTRSYLIIKFTINPEFVNPILTFKANPTIQVLHTGAAPTVFRLYINSGIISEFEVYNGDYSDLNYDSLCSGTIIKEVT